MYDREQVHNSLSGENISLPRAELSAVGRGGLDSGFWASCLAALLRSVTSMPSPLGCISGLVLKFKFPGVTYNSAHTASCFHVKMQSK